MDLKAVKSLLCVAFVAHRRKTVPGTTQIVAGDRRKRVDSKAEVQRSADAKSSRE